jgi:hypothetical protein
MNAKREYLYGDSTPASVKTEFIAFLRAAIDFAVDVMRRDGLVADAIERTQQLSERTEREIEKAESVAAEVSLVLDATMSAQGDSLAARCAVKAREGIAQVVRAEAELARALVAAEAARATKAAETAREACVRALEALVVRQHLPDAAVVAKVSLQAGAYYDVEFHGHTRYGLRWVVSAKVPPGHALEHALRVEHVVERLEVDAPESVGWLHKEVRARPQRLDRLYVTELETGPGSAVIKLRAAPDDASAGFDLVFSQGMSAVSLVRRREGQVAEPAHPIEGADGDKLRSLHHGLVAVVNELAAHRDALVRASLDETPLQKLEAPRDLVERLVASIAPTVEEISRASAVPGELVIKRQLDDGRREEVFVSKAELFKRVQTLPLELRGVFDPLGLGPLERPSGATTPSQPPGQNNMRGDRPLTSTGRWPSPLPSPEVDGIPSDIPGPMSRTELAAAEGADRSA